MSVWVLWTHYDCEVNVMLYATKHECYLDLKGWLDDCSVEDCGHDLETMDDDDIADALEYHWEEVSYDISLYEVPIVQPPPVPMERPLKEVGRTTVPTMEGSYADVLGRLQEG